ncbi:MAG: hypothetical protein HC866_00120 [Leptolyngbyaceae cyanobacterium RU_5_1]|nr:hypothetical protein [Leptolyngbyaceae cyanobacterium RU_5_1]
MKWLYGLLGLAVAIALATSQPPVAQSAAECDKAYPDVCIAPPPPNLDCKDIPYRNFKVLSPDPHDFDIDQDGIGCESKK